MGFYGNSFPAPEVISENTDINSYINDHFLQGALNEDFRNMMSDISAYHDGKIDAESVLENVVYAIKNKSFDDANTLRMVEGMLEAFNYRLKTRNDQPSDIFTMDEQVMLEGLFGKKHATEGETQRFKALLEDMDLLCTFFYNALHITGDFLEFATKEYSKVKNVDTARKAYANVAKNAKASNNKLEKESDKVPWETNPLDSLKYGAKKLAKLESEELDEARSALDSKLNDYRNEIQEYIKPWGEGEKPPKLVALNEAIDNVDMAMPDITDRVMATITPWWQYFCKTYNTSINFIIYVRRQLGVPAAKAGKAFAMPTSFKFKAK